MRTPRRDAVIQVVGTVVCGASPGDLGRGAWSRCLRLAEALDFPTALLGFVLGLACVRFLDAGGSTPRWRYALQAGAREGRVGLRAWVRAWAWGAASYSKTVDCNLNADMARCVGVLTRGCRLEARSANTVPGVCPGRDFRDGWWRCCPCHICAEIAKRLCAHGGCGVCANAGRCEDAARRRERRTRTRGAGMRRAQVRRTRAGDGSGDAARRRERRAWVPRVKDAQTIARRIGA